MENEFNRVDRIMNRFEDLLTESNKQMNDRINENERKHLAWRNEYEDKNHNIFKEMSAALKSLKKQIMKVNKDSDDRDQELGKLIEDSKKLAEGMFKNLDEKANHLEEVYNFKLDESTKVWSHNLQIEVDKVLDAISKNTDAVQTDFVKRMANLKLEVNKTMFDNVDKEVHNLKELVADTKRVIEDSTISKLKDIEVRLENLFRVRFDEYRIKLEDSIREFNRLKGEMEHIKKDYYNALETVREDMKANTRREVETMKGQLVNRIKESKDQLDELLASTSKAMKEEIELNKLDMHRSVDAAKLDIQSELQTSTNDIKNMVDKNDQIIHADVNNKMNSLNTEIDTQKRFLMERMDEMHETTKSLARALVAEEAANRANKDEMIIKLFDRKINNLNSYIMSQVEQKLDELRINLENKIKDALNDLEDFKRWTIDEFSKVRTEHEHFKQEYYARDYADHLYFLTFESMVRASFDSAQRQFHEARLALENLRDDMQVANKKLRKDLEEETNDRKEADEENEEKFENYRKLNEKTWEEMILMYQTEIYTGRLNLSMVEEAIYESIRRIIASLGTLGGASDDLMKKLQEVNQELGKHKDKTAKQDKENSSTFKSVNEKATAFRSDYDGFVKVARKNFDITEDSLSILSHLINSLDSQVNIDQMMSMATFNLLEQRSAAGIAEVEGYMRVMNKETNDKMDDKLKKQEKKIVEDIIPGQILKVNESLNTLGQQSKDTTAKLTETLQKKISEHSITLEKHDKDLKDHSKQLNQHSQRIKHAEENIQDAGQDFKKIEKAVHETNAHVVMEGINAHAEINLIKAGMVETIKDIYSTLASMETSDNTDNAEATASLGKVTKRIDSIDKKMAELDKLDKKLADLSKTQGKQEDRLKKVEEAKDKGKDNESKKGSTKDVVDSKELKDLKKEIAALAADVKALKAAKGKDKNKSDDGEEEGEEEEEESKKKGKGKDKNKGKGDSEDLKKLQKQVSDLQKQYKELEDRVEELENGKDKSGEEEEEESKKTDKKGKGDKNKGKKSKENSDDEESTKISQEDLDNLEEKIDKKLEELKEELLEKIDNAKDKSGEEEEDEESDKKGKGKGKGKKGKKDDDSEKDSKEENDNEERFKDIEKRLDELEEKAGEEKSKDKKDDDDEGSDKKKELEEVNEKIEELEKRIEELETAAEEKGDDKDKSKSKDDKDKDDDEDIDAKIDEKLEEMKEKLKEEIKEELKEEKGDKDEESDDKKDKSGDNNKIWDEINELKDKVEEIDQLNAKIEEIEKEIAELKGDDDKD